MFFCRLTLFVVCLYFVCSRLRDKITELLYNFKDRFALSYGLKLYNHGGVMKNTAAKGTQDILPEISSAWEHIEDKFREICQLYGYEEIRTPTFEHTEVFARGVGETSDVVQKEMYTFEDKGNRSITLRPEGTAGIVRSFIEKGMNSLAFPVKLFYEITAFRYENVQKGRYREFHQLGVEAFGAEGPFIDAEMLAMLQHFFKTLGLKQINLEINSLGTPESRKVYREALLGYLRPHKNELCEDCQARMEENPLRVLDCKNEHCHEITKSAPLILDYLDEESERHFNKLRELLDNLGVEYKVNPKIVRGLDYYSKTVFEFISENVGAQGTICGGGRYDGLIKLMGGQDTPGIGFALGEERLLLELEAQGVLKNDRPVADVFIASLDDEALIAAQKLSQELRHLGVRAQYELTGRSLKAQMKYAGKQGAKNLIVLGGDELSEGKAAVRSLVEKDKAEHEFDLDQVEVLADYLEN